MSTEENKVVVRRLWEEIANHGNVDAADELLASDYVYRTPGSPELRGADGYKQLITIYRSAFPDLELTIDDLIGEGEKVVHRFTARGTHRGELMGVAPTGRQIVVEGLIASRFEDGKVAEDWEVFDVMGMWQQLGIVPTPMQTAAQ
jgi:steroid delta-isomerase-like uncharacterized protein